MRKWVCVKEWGFHTRIHYHSKIQVSMSFCKKKLIHLLSKDTLNWLKVAVRTYLTNLISNKCSLYLASWKKKKAFYKSIRSAFSTLIIINVNHKILHSKILKILLKGIRVKHVPFQDWFCHLWAVHWGTEIYAFQETQKLEDQEEHWGKICTQNWQLIWNNMRRINEDPAAYIDYPNLPLLKHAQSLFLAYNKEHYSSHFKYQYKGSIWSQLPIFNKCEDNTPSSSELSY